MKPNYEDKYKKFLQNLNLSKFSQKERDFIKEKAFLYRFSFQELKQLVDMAIDLKMWGEGSLEDLWKDFHKGDPRSSAKASLEHFKLHWERLKNSPIKFGDKPLPYEKRSFSVSMEEKERLGFGMCPVASYKTRCCNLMTLDAVESCGFDCSYCSIQSFYNEDKIVFDKDYGKKLRNIKLDPNEIYHIGTGQSSDSLMWGNRYGLLDALTEFARNNKNVILEKKTKSDRVEYFLKNDIPKNIICTWSLNPQKVIDNEEHLTASLEDRLKAAKKVHDRGILVGFHFHPMIYYEGWEDEYKDICDRLLKEFDPENVVMVSIGTLTFIKPVIKKIRKRNFYSKILQIPLVDADGKLSYPKETKIKMFKHLYNSLSPWHGKVFFYMCMENHSLWKEVFGYEYPTNESFEMDMKLNYMKKIINKY